MKTEVTHEMTRDIQLDLGLTGVASQQEAIAGVSNEKAMTPLRVSQAIASIPPPTLGTMATKDEGTGPDEFRDNADNDARFVRIETAQTITGAKEFTGGISLVGDSSGSRMRLQRTGSDVYYIAGLPSELRIGNETAGVNLVRFLSGDTRFADPISSPGGTASNQHRTNAQNDARYVQLTGDQNVGGVKTFTSGLSITMAEPQWAMTDTSDGNKAVAIALSGNQFLIAADRNGDGNVEAPIALLLNSDNNTAQLYGSLAYTRANILGAVGQSGGVPTGSIMESGANANGSYTRYADGRLECRRSATVDLTSTAGQVFNLPATFSDFPAMTWSGGPGSISSDDLPALASAWVYETSSSASRWIFRTNVAGATTAYTVQLLAVGRWF